MHCRSFALYPRCHHKPRWPGCSFRHGDCGSSSGLRSFPFRCHCHPAEHHDAVLTAIHVASFKPDQQIDLGLLFSRFPSKLFVVCLAAWPHQQLVCHGQDSAGCAWCWEPAHRVGTSPVSCSPPVPRSSFSDRSVIVFFTDFCGKFQILLFILALPFIMRGVGSPHCCNENQEKHNNSKGNVKMLFKIRCAKHWS